MLFGNKRAIIDDPSNLADSLINSMYTTINKFKPSESNPLYIALDCNRKSNWRYEFYEKRKVDIPIYNDSGATYKGNRTKDESFDWPAIYQIVQDVTEVLDKFTDVRVVGHPSVEADDIMYVGSQTFPSTIMITSDKDMFQLHSDRVRQYDPMKKKFVELETSKEEYLHIHTIIGDKVDNIMPIKKGIGPKKAAKISRKELLSELAIDSDMSNRYTFNKTLIDLSELPDDYYDEIKESFRDSVHGSFKYGELVKFCQKYRLITASEKLHKFKFL